MLVVEMLDGLVELTFNATAFERCALVCRVDLIEVVCMHCLPLSTSIASRLSFLLLEGIPFMVLLRAEKYSFTLVCAIILT